MSARANPYHNAWTESFMGTLKSEMLQDGCFLNEADARTEVFDYIDSYYNIHRKHSALGYQTPAQFEAKIHSLNETTNGPKTGWISVLSEMVDGNIVTHAVLASVESLPPGAGENVFDAENLGGEDGAVGVGDRADAGVRPVLVAHCHFGLRGILPQCQQLGC